METASVLFTPYVIFLAILSVYTLGHLRPTPLPNVSNVNTNTQNNEQTAHNIHKSLFHLSVLTQVILNSVPSFSWEDKLF